MSASRPTKPSSAAMRSRTRPAFIRTGCSRTAGRTRSCGRRTLACRRRRSCWENIRAGTRSQRRCEQFGLTLSRQDLDAVYRLMVTLADTQKHVTDDDLRRIVFEVSGATTTQTTPLSREIGARSRLRVRRVNARIVLMPGDGIGPEVTTEAVRVLARVGQALVTPSSSSTR